MATARGFSWGAFFAGVVATIVLAVAVAAIIIFGGFYPVGAATSHTSGVRWLFAESRDHAVTRSAASLQAPRLSQADAMEGGSHFKGMCQACHGGPGVEPGEFASGMNPRPPDLARTTGDLSLQEVFWIAKNGLKMTGMPAFGKTDEDEELWKIAAFVKQLPKVSASDYASLPNAHEHEDEHEHGEAAGEMAGDKH